MISIVVIAYREENYIRYLLYSLLKQESKEFEVIFVMPKNDPTEKIVRNFLDRYAFFPWKIVYDPGKGPGPARNIGAKYAKNPYILFVEGDCFLIKNSIDKLIDYLKKRSIYLANIRFQLVTYKFHRKKIKIIDRFVSRVLLSLGFLILTFTRLPAGTGTFLLVYRPILNKIKFPNILPNEDIEFIKKVKKVFKIKNRGIFLLIGAESNRRLLEKGSIKSYVKNSIYNLLFKKYTKKSHTYIR